MLTAAVLAALGALLGEISAGILTVAEAIDALLELGFVYTGAQDLGSIANYISNLIAGSPAGGNQVAAAVAPVPALTQAPACGTKPQHSGICCAAVTQLGLARAAQGFQYTSCTTGKTVCLACGTKASTSKKHPGQTVFSVKRVSCGPSGCPALSTLQGQITNPV
jgi:hypothetical protein